MDIEYTVAGINVVHWFGVSKCTTYNSSLKRSYAHITPTHVGMNGEISESKWQV